MTIPMIKKTTHRNIAKQVGYYFLSFWVALSFMTTLFVLVPMMYFYLRPLAWDVNYIEIRPVETVVGKPLVFESIRHNVTSGTNVFSDTLVCIDADGNVLLNEQSDSLRNVEAQARPTTVKWEFAEGNFIVNQPYDMCKLYSRISRVRPFVGMISETRRTEWFKIE